jgi:mannose-6-phosphate isomerase-like protein (cupin superfamily)
MIEFDNRPWGRWEEYLNEPGYRVKRIIVNPGKRLSLQKHSMRKEFWVVVAGTGKITLGDETREIGKDDTIFIDKEQVHRIENTSDDHLVFIETQVGICLEDDIVRLEDDWGRA